MKDPFTTSFEEILYLGVFESLNSPAPALANIDKSRRNKVCMGS